MSIAVLNEVFIEARRLSIAGSVVAPNDFRLKKLIEPLKSAGSKAPVFAKVAECVEAVVQANEQTAAPALLSLSALLCSILFTQGGTGVDGEFKSIDSIQFPVGSKQSSARLLKPLLEALSSTGSGRVEQVRSAIAAGMFAELRLVQPALNALDDPSHEIATLVAENVLPTYGKAILGDLRGGFDLQGKRGHALRLRLMHQLDPIFARPTVLAALSEGALEIKIAAIACLGESAEDLTHLFEQAKAKNKEIRAAVYRVLAQREHAEALAILCNAIDGKDLNTLVQATHDLRLPKLAGEALARLPQLLAAAQANTDKAKQGEQVARLLLLMRILAGALGDAAVQFLQQCITAKTELLKVHSSPGGMDIIEFAVDTLAQGDPASTQFLLAQCSVLPAQCFSKIAQIAKETLSPADFYQQFSVYLNRKSKKNSNEHLRYQQLFDLLALEHYGIYMLDPQTGTDQRWLQRASSFDPRWLQDAIANDELELVVGLALPGDAPTQHYLSTVSKDRKRLSKDNLASRVGLALHRTQHPAFDAFVLDYFKLVLKTNIGYRSFLWLRLAAHLGKAMIPELEALAADTKLSDHNRNELLEIIETIRARPSAA